jgi:hypothetical protein
MNSDVSPEDGGSNGWPVVRVKFPRSTWGELKLQIVARSSKNAANQAGGRPILEESIEDY